MAYLYINIGMHNEQLLAYSLKYEGDYASINSAILTNEPYVQTMYKGFYFTILDDIYPKSLKYLKNPPFVLYYRGNIKLLEDECVSVIGSREAIEYAKKWTILLVKELTQNNTIVSGLAKGIDGLAHRVALEYGKTIAVLGSGIDVIYPKSNTDLYHQVSKLGLILSEYPEGTQVRKHQFVMRNRIIAGLGKCLFVMQSNLKSGSMITVNYALDCGKDVYCLPFNCDQDEGAGNNFLIQQGANILTNPLELTKL